MAPLEPNIHNTEFLDFGFEEIRLVNNICKLRITQKNNIYWEKYNKDVKDNEVKNFILGSAFGGILIQRGFFLLMQVL